MGHADLTRTTGNGFGAINGQPVQKIVEHTLRSAEALVSVWDELEPLARKLVKKLREATEADPEHDEAMRLLALTATVIQKLGGAAANVLRASEGQAKLALLLESGKPQRKPVEAQSQKQLVATMVELLKKVKELQGSCPICSRTVET